MSSKRRFWHLQSYRYQTRGGTGLSEVIAREELSAASELWNAYNAQPQGLTLDLGAGGGGFWNYCVPPQILIALDLMPSIAPSNIYQHRILADAAHLPFESNSISSILALGLLEYIVDPKAALREWRRVCRDDAFLLVSNSPPIFPNRLRKWLGLGAIPRRDDEIAGALVCSGWRLINEAPRRAGWQSLFVAKAEL